MPIMTTLHIIHLQLNLHADFSVEIVCDDPLASIDAKTGILTINLPRSPRGSQNVRFVVRDPAVRGDCYFYATMLSGRSRDALVHWHKDGDVSRSPYIAADTTLEIWASVLAQPPDPADVRAYHGRRNTKIATQGGGDLSALNP